MKLVNHSNYFDHNGQVYCEKLMDVVRADEKHYENYCLNCRFFNGHLFGEGVECLYEDSTVKDGEEVIGVTDPFEYLEKRRKASAIERERKATDFTVKR
jgi:tetrahydromethanopterin S-methyltransferase subunit A